MKKFLAFEDCFSVMSQNIMWNKANNQQPLHLKIKRRPNFREDQLRVSLFHFFLTWKDCHTWKQSSPRIRRRGTESAKLVWKAWGTRDPIEYVCVAILEIGISLQSRINSSPEETSMKSGGTEARFLSEEQNWAGLQKHMLCWID